MSSGCAIGLTYSAFAILRMNSEMDSSEPIAANEY